MVDRNNQFLSLAGNHDELLEGLLVERPGSRLEGLEQGKDLRDRNGGVDLGESLEQTRKDDGLQASDVTGVVLLSGKAGDERSNLLDRDQGVEVDLQELVQLANLGGHFAQGVLGQLVQIVSGRNLDAVQYSRSQPTVPFS